MATCPLEERQPTPIRLMSTPEVLGVCGTELHKTPHLWQRLQMTYSPCLEPLVLCGCSLQPGIMLDTTTWELIRYAK